MPVQKSTNLSIPQRASPRLKLDYDIPYFGTLDTTTDMSLMEEENSPDNLNVVYDTIKAVASRKGYTKLLTTSTPSFIGGMYPLYKSNGDRQLIYASGTNWYRYDNAGSSIQIGGTPAKFTTDLQWSMDEYQDNIYGGNGIDGLIKYDGLATSIANAGITPQFVKVHKNRVYCANKNSSTLYFSDAASPSSFPVNNFILINTNDGQNITGITDILDNLIIFKDDSIWILTGEPLGAGNTTTIGNLQLRQVNSPVGCSAFRTIARVDQTVFFMHHTGIYALQNYNVTLVSPLLSKTFKQDMNENIIATCWGIYSNQEKKYILGYPSVQADANDSALVYDFLTRTFSRWDDIPGNCAVSFKFSGANETICMGDPKKGNIYELFQGTVDIAGDNGTATDATATSITDTSKHWVPGQFVDCRVGAVVTNASGGTTVLPIGIVSANTANKLVFASDVIWGDFTWGEFIWGGQVSNAIQNGVVPTKGMTYTIGYFTSYWKSKNFDFNMIGHIKKYRFLNMFADTATYNMQFGYSIDFSSLGFQKAFKLSINAPLWGTFTWGNFIWGGVVSEFGQANIGSAGRYIQFMFGNNIAFEPWRCIHYSVTYKLKKLRPNIVTV